MVFSGENRQHRMAQVAALLTGHSRGLVDLSELLIASRGEQMVGASLAVVGAGAAAQYWPVQLVGGENETTAERLYEAQESRLRGAGVRFVQTFLPKDSRHDARRLEQFGFAFACDLVWLACRLPDSGVSPPGEELQFSEYDGDQARMAGLVERTYEQSLDCPRLNRQRATLDVLAGYHAAHPLRTSRWWYVRQNGRDVGCLLLADQAECQQLEIVYFGLAPEFRGRGWGMAITRFAQWFAAARGRRRVSLAVDAENAYAHRIYSRAGLTPFDLRRVFTKVLAADRASHAAE